MEAVLRVLLALVRSHGAEVGRRSIVIALWGVGIMFFGMVAAIYLVILVTYLLTLALGTGWALAAITVAALAGAFLMLIALRRSARRLMAAHRAHLEQERLALKGAGIEAVEAGKLGGSIAAVSTSLAAVIVIILRRLGRGEARPGPQSDRGEAQAGAREG